MDIINHIEIKNFKSIKDLKLNCNRINVFVGKPNVGKSNILEALDLSYLSSLFHTNKSYAEEKKDIINIKDFFRVDKANDLFYRGDTEKPIILDFIRFGSKNRAVLTLDFIKSDDERGWNKKLKDQNFFRLKINGSETDFNNDFYPLDETSFFSSPITPFKYKEHIQFHDVGNYHNLIPPYGNNLPQVIDSIPSLKEFISDEVSKLSNVDFAIDKKSNLLTIQLRIGKGLIYSLPYRSIADTLKRLIFYIAAIKSDYDVVTLEEPEAHSFPPYVSMMTDEIIANKETQFFIATHSSVLLTNLIENTPKDELAVFVCGYDDKEHSTTAKRLSSDDLSELLDYGVDIFFNINRYLDDRIEHSA